jgi:hypothetical protein
MADASLCLGNYMLTARSARVAEIAEQFIFPLPLRGRQRETHQQLRGI